MLNLATIFGWIGDTLTFIGAMVLVWKEFRTVPEFREVEAAKTELADFNNGLETKEREKIKSAEDLQASILTHNSRQAKCGALLIAAGFLFLLITRYTETIEGAQVYPTQRYNVGEGTSRHRFDDEGWYLNGRRNAAKQKAVLL